MEGQGFLSLHARPTAAAEAPPSQDDCAEEAHFQSAGHGLEDSSALHHDQVGRNAEEQGYGEQGERVSLEILLEESATLARDMLLQSLLPQLAGTLTSLKSETSKLDMLLHAVNSR